MTHLKLSFSLFILVITTFADNKTDIIRQESLPELQHLSRVKDTVAVDSTIISTSDSAVFTSPPLRTLLSGTEATIGIQPKCAVDSVIIFARHSGTVIDTILRKSSPPFEAIWNFSSLSDQDQIHLQFGYTLYLPNRKTIHSTPFPHQWIIDRNKKNSHKKYSCKEIISPDTIIVDGKLDEWPEKKWGKIGSACTFTFRWTSKILYFAAKVNTPHVSSHDMLELHLDPNQTRTSFASDAHRSIRFSPRGRTFCFVSSYNDSLKQFIQNDSIASLLLENLQWSTNNTSTGYTIEAAIPFFALSDRDFPKLESGFDISFREGNIIVSWANKGSFNRYNPSEWGTLVLRQAMLPLKIFMFTAAIIIGIIFLTITFVVIRHYIQNERMELEDCKGGSDELKHLQDILAQNYTDSSLTLPSFAAKASMTQEKISSILSNELGCDFERFIEFKRISSAKLLLWDFSLSIEVVAVQSGFDNSGDFQQVFRRYYHTDPDSFRESIRDMKEDDDEKSAGNDTSNVTGNS